MQNPLSGQKILKERLLSLDVMRGLIMILLAGESCLLYVSMQNLTEKSSFVLVVDQFFHHPWNGLHFWDLVQPAFMMMAGSALYISWYHKTQKGISWSGNFRHVAIRCFKLFLFGVALHCVYAGQLVWELWNVLVQLSITTVIAYLIIRKSAVFQIIFSVFLLLLTEIAYRNVLVTGFDQPFTEHHNFGAYVDTLLMGKINSDGWVTINFIPTAVHTIIGVLAGKVLISRISASGKIKSLLVPGVLCLILGFGLDLSGITPIIKRISTTSFILASAGWVLLLMAFLYWLTDIRKVNKHVWIFVVVGMNSIFIYLFFETIGIQWLNPTVAIFIKGLLNITSVNSHIQSLFTAGVTLILEWYLCYWLYKRKIFFKL